MVVVILKEAFPFQLIYFAFLIVLNKQPNWMLDLGINTGDKALLLFPRIRLIGYSGIPIRCGPMRCHCPDRTLEAMRPTVSIFS